MIVKRIFPAALSIRVSRRPEPSRMEESFRKTPASDRPMSSSTFDDGGYVVLDAELMESLRLEKGLSRRQFAELAEVSPTTAYRFFQGQRVQTRIARRLFDGLGIVDMKPYLLATDRAESELAELDKTVLAEWRIENIMSHPV